MGLTCLRSGPILDVLHDADGVDGVCGAVMAGQVNKDLSDGKAPGLDNLLYSADADFSCFAVRTTSATTRLLPLPH